MPAPVRPDTLARALANEMPAGVRPRRAPGAGSSTFHAEQVRKARESEGAQSAAKIGARSTIEQPSIDALVGKVDTRANKAPLKNDLEILKLFNEGRLSPGDANFVILQGQIADVLRQHPGLSQIFGSEANPDALFTNYAGWLMTSQSNLLSADIFQQVDVLIKQEPPMKKAELTALEGAVNTASAEKNAKALALTLAQTQEITYAGTIADFAQGGSKEQELSHAVQNEPSNRQRITELDKKIVQQTSDLSDLDIARESRRLNRTIPAIDGQIDDVNSEIDRLTKELTKYKPGTPDNIQTQEKLKQIHKQRDMLNKEKSCVTRYQGVGDLDAELALRSGELQGNITAKTTAQQEIDKIKLLRDELTHAKKELPQASQDVVDAQAALVKATADYETAVQQLADAKAQIDAWEKQLGTTANQIMAESARNWINTEIDQLDAAFNTYSQEQLVEQEKSAKDRFMMEAEKRVTKAHKKGPRTDKKMVNEYAIELYTNGPDALLDKIRQTGNFTDEEFKQIKGDPDVRNHVISNILGRQMLANGISEAQVEHITRSSWGQDVIKNALESNKAVANAIAEAAGAKVMDSKFWSAIRNNKWLLLFILLGGLVGTAIAGPAGGLLAGGVVTEAGGAVAGMGAGALTAGMGVEAGINH